MFVCLVAATCLALQPEVRAELLCANEAVAPGETVTIGVLFTIPAGWHIYWKNPGDTGMATSVAWQLPYGTWSGPLLWPTPKPISTSSGTSYGYEGKVSLLSRFTVTELVKPGTKLTIRATVNWLECKETCIPGNSTVSITLPVVKQGRVNLYSKQLLGESWLQLPKVNSLSARAVWSEDIALSARLPEATSAYFFPEVSEVIDHTAKQQVGFDKNHLTLRMKKSEFARTSPERLVGVLQVVLIDGTMCNYQIDLPFTKNKP